MMINQWTTHKILFSPLLLLLAFSTFSCNDVANHSSTDSIYTAPPRATNSANVAPKYSEREGLIKALQQLQRDMSSKDKQAIAAYFPFPVPGDDLQVFDISEDFDKAVEQNHYQVSQQLFLSNFDALYENLEMQGFTDLFQHLPLSKLQDTATKQIEMSRPDNVCTHFYSITIEGHEVTLQYGVNTNEDYLKKHPKEEAECPEYAAFWTFLFDDTKLIFVRHQVAG